MVRRRVVRDLSDEAVLPIKRFLPMMSTSDAGKGLNMEEFSFMSKRLPEKETGERGWGWIDVPAVPGSSLCPHFYSSGPGK